MSATARRAAGAAEKSMPEGPEIRRAADRVASVLAGETIVHARLALPRIRKFAARLEGATVTAVDTHGKAMLTRFDNGLTLYSHNQLYGRWYITRRPKLPDTNRQLRVAFHTETHSALLYSASDIEVLTQRQLERHPFLSRLGPDILNTTLNAQSIAKRLDDAKFRNRSLNALYLDQSFIAGLGNYLRSEILWAARIDPGARTSDLDAKARARLAGASLRIARRSYRTSGLTVPSALARSLRAKGWTFEQRRFQVFGRQGLDCHHCGSTIERHSMAGRNLFLCPGCQPKK